MAEVDDYLALIAAEHRKQPDFIAWLRVLIQGQVDAQNLALKLPGLFDLDNAVGDQLDKVGEWIGLTRFITEPLQSFWFSFDVPSLGFDEANWFVPTPFQAPATAIVRLDDNHYRLLLKVRVIANTWNGTIPDAYSAWSELFAAEGFQILIQNVAGRAIPPTSPPGAHVSGDMHIVYAIVGPPLDPLTKALFAGGYLDLKPAAVMIEAYATQGVQGIPLFAFDVGPSMPGVYTCPPVCLAGFDIGAFADISIPGG